MTNQQIFNKVTKHLLKQGKKSRDAGQCLYRGPDGLKCAIGALIPNDKYTSALEGGISRAVCEAAGIDYQTQGIFAQSLQAIHDSSSPSKWAGKLRKFAKDNNLNLPKELR